MSLRDLVGHETAVRLLKGQMVRQRLAHTYLFIGSKGIGKGMLAAEFAKALECEVNREADPCGECESCLKVSKGTHPDVKVVSSGAETDPIKIDQIRELAGWMSLTPYGEFWKVALIEGADRLTQEASHALLKLLEEPPGKSILILTARGLHSLSSTLVSRCHVVRCVPQGIGRVASFLEQREGLDPALASLLAHLSGGRLGLALDFHRNQRLVKKNQLVNQLLSGWRQNSVEISLGTAPVPEVEEALEWFAAWWRDLLVLSVGGDPSWLIHQDRIEDLKKEKEPGPTEILLDRVRKTYWVQEAMQSNASPRIALGALLGSSR